MQAQDSIASPPFKDSLVHVFDASITQQEKTALESYLVDNFDTTAVKISIVLSPNPEQLPADSCFLELLMHWKKDSQKEYGVFLLTFPWPHSPYMLVSSGWKEYLDEDFHTQLQYRRLIHQSDSSLFQQTQFVAKAIFEELKKDLIPTKKSASSGTIPHKKAKGHYTPTKGGGKPTFSLPFQANFGILMLWFLGIAIYLSFGLYLFFGRKKKKKQI